MRKSDKKLDNQLRTELTKLCENELKHQCGFQWLTHSVNYSRFPKSLMITCVFDQTEDVKRFCTTPDYQTLRQSLSSIFNELGIKVNKIEQHLAFDSEQACDTEHGGNWAKRLG